MWKFKRGYEKLDQDGFVDVLTSDPKFDSTMNQLQFAARVENLRGSRGAYDCLQYQEVQPPDEHMVVESARTGQLRRCNTRSELFETRKREFLARSRAIQQEFERTHSIGGSDSDFKNQHLISFPIRAKDYAPEITPRNKAVPPPLPREIPAHLKTFVQTKRPKPDPTDTMNLKGYLHSLLNRNWAAESVL